MIQPPDDRFTELAPDYALGLLEAENLDEFERHLADGCTACERELASMDAVGDALAHAPPPLRVPAGLRDRVLAAVHAERPAAPAEASPAEPRVPIESPANPIFGTAPASPSSTVAAAPPAPRSAWSRGAPLLAVGGLVAAVLLGFMSWRLQGQLTLLHADLERVQAEKQAFARVLDVVRSAELRLVPLAGLAAAPQSHGRVLWSPEERKAVLHAYGLPRPPARRDYQLWVIEGEVSRNEGVFPVDAAGRATHVLAEMPAAQGVTGFAVTLEPAGGVSRPQGETILFGPVPAAPED